MRMSLRFPNRTQSTYRWRGGTLILHVFTNDLISVTFDK
jgi:hypothetical protein